MNLKQIRIDDSIAHIIPRCRLGCIMFEQVTVKGTPPALTQEYIKLQQEVSSVYQLNILPKLPRILAVRSMYKKLAFDPVRYRPASEALVRRVLQNKGVYYVNSAVDVNNYCSIKTLLPFGLYDLDKIEGDISYQLASEGTYTGISGNTVNTENKPFLTDTAGVFGNPTADSFRTAVTLASANLLTVIFADEEVSDATLSGIMDFAAEMMVRYNGGRVIFQHIVHADS